MSANSLALTAHGDWIPVSYSGASSPDHDQRHGQPATVPWPLYFRSGDEAYYSPWRLFEERVRTGPFGIARFPLQPFSPIRILFVDTGTEERVNPRLRQFIRTSSPARIRGDWHLGLSQGPEERTLTNEEFKKAMKKLRKQAYVPSYTNSKPRRRGLFSSWSSGNNTTESEDEKKDEGKDCAICLEAFVLNDQVLVTPCNHMFHNDCLVPWVKSHGQCPVCRLALCERRERALAPINGTTTLGEDDLALDLIALMRAMEEAFNWVSLH